PKALHLHLQPVDPAAAHEQLRAAVFARPAALDAGGELLEAAQIAAQIDSLGEPRLAADPDLHLDRPGDRPAVRVLDLQLHPGELPHADAERVDLHPDPVGAGVGGEEGV
ncbi:MAG: hypothetical protein ACK559_22050, partial [bacterium]